MMMTQSYYDGGDMDQIYHSHHRNLRTVGNAFYNRVAPYGYVDNSRQDLRAEYGDRNNIHQMIHEPDTNAPNEQQRRRIAVAVQDQSKTFNNIVADAAIVRTLSQTQNQMLW